ncbi:MAG: hypothetical protein AB8B61_03665 [Cyclobacteriaceae bacterium]
MLKPYYLFTFLSLILFSCSNHSRKNINLPNRIEFEVKDNETVHQTLSKETTNAYFSFFNSKSRRIPLFKTIETEKHTLYLGMPYNTSLKGLFKHDLLKNTSKLILSKTDSSTYFYKKYHLGDTTIINYVNQTNQNLISVLLVSTNLSNTDSISSLENLSKRIIKKN